MKDPGRYLIMGLIIVPSLESSLIPAIISLHSALIRREKIDSIVPMYKIQLLSIFRSIQGIGDNNVPKK